MVSKQEQNITGAILSSGLKKLGIFEVLTFLIPDHPPVMFRLYMVYSSPLRDNKRSDRTPP